MGTTAPTLNLTIGISDLTSASQLKKLIQGDAKPVLTFGTQIAPYWGAPLQTVPNGTSAAITVSGSGSWKTSGDAGINFALSAGAKCQVKIVTSGAVLNYAPDLKSQATAELPEKPYPGCAYVVLLFDFQISGGVSGGGNIGAVGIAGNAKGSTDTSVQFCHLVADNMKLSEAIIEALEKFTFAFEPNCAIDMSAGDIAQVNFNGTLACGLNVSYGITNVSFSAPGVASTLDSATKGLAQFTLPSGKVAIGAEASLSYRHSDDFTAIVQRSDSKNAFLYVMRAHKNEESEGLRVTAKVSITNHASAKLDQQKLEKAVNSIAGGGGEQAAAKVLDLEQALNGKLDTWINNTVNQGASLGLEWDRAKAVSMLFKYSVDVSEPSLVTRSWTSLCNGDLFGAVGSGGLLPETGSGISTEIDRSFTLSLQFFNLFSASSKTTYFQKTYVVVTPCGTLRYIYDIGHESDVEVRKSKKVCNVHFVVTVDESSAKTVSNADVNLVLEIVAINDQKEAGRIADLVGMIPPNQQVNQVQKGMQQFVASNPSGTLDLACILTPSAYGRLSCSEYVGNNPPVNQQQDSENWARFHDASVSLLNLEFVEDLTYRDWRRFNVLCVYGQGFSGTPDRRHPGNPAAVPPGFWDSINAPSDLIGYFLLNSADFMNLCDDLHQLAGLATLPNNSTQDILSYNSLLRSLVELIVKRDVNTDYSKAAIGALLRLSNPQKVTSKTTTGKNAFSCTINLS